MIEGLQRTLALFVALTAVCSGQDGAGIALGITASDGGLNRLADIGGRIIEKYANSGRFTIPDVDPNGLVISNIRITKLSVDRSVLTTSSSGITPDVEVSAALAFDWRYCKRFRIIGRICHDDSGTVNARIALRTTLQLEVTDGEYRAQVKECTPRISNFDIHLGSRILSRILNAVIGIAQSFFRDAINRRIAEELCRPLVKLLENEGSEALNGFDKSRCIDEFSCIDYSLVRSLVTTDNFVEARARGMFYSLTKNNTKPHPFLPGNLTVGPPLYANCAFYVHVSEYVANTALNVYYRAGQLKYTACLPFQFDLTLRILMSVNPFCTRRAQFAFKDRPSPDQICTGQFFIKAARRPFIEINNNSIIINLSAHAELVMAGCSICSMPLDAVAALVVNVTMENSTDSDNNVTEVIKLSGRALSFDIRLNSKLCPVIIFGVSALFPKLLDRMVERLANSIVLPALNSKLGEGFTLPDLPDEIHLVHHSLHLNNGYITACFDLDYFDTS